jgi:hypothetical protein
MQNNCMRSFGLPRELVLQKGRIEIGAFFALAGAAFASVAVALALIWHRFR